MVITNYKLRITGQFSASFA